MGLRERAKADAKRREQEKTERQKKVAANRRAKLKVARRETAEWISELLDVDLSAGALGAPTEDGPANGLSFAHWEFNLDGFRLRAEWEDTHSSSGDRRRLYVLLGEGDEEKAKPVRRPADLLEEV